MDWRRGTGIILAVAAAGCDQLASDPPEPVPAAAVAAPVPVPDLGPYIGRSYADFAAEHADRFGPAGLGLSEIDAARLGRSMGASSGALIEGGGAEALVFGGCAEGGCSEGAAVVAVDARTGEAFAGVRDGGGEDVLVPNDRLEALLRLNAPTRHWAEVAPQVQSADAAPEAARP